MKTWRQHYNIFGLPSRSDFSVGSPWNFLPMQVKDEHTTLLYIGGEVTGRIWTMTILLWEWIFLHGLNAMNSSFLSFLSKKVFWSATDEQLSFSCHFEQWWSDQWLDQRLELLLLSPSAILKIFSLQLQGKKHLWSYHQDSDWQTYDLSMSLII